MYRRSNASGKNSSIKLINFRRGKRTSFCVEWFIVIKNIYVTKIRNEAKNLIYIHRKIKKIIS